MFRKRITFLVVFIFVFYLLAFLFLAFISKGTFNRGWYSLRQGLFLSQKTKNGICDQELYGEPLDSTNNFIKINFYCDKDKSSKNTISLNVIKTKNMSGVIEEISRINNFEMDDNFDCYLERMVIEDWNQSIVSGKTIDCLAPGMKITDIYKI